MATFLYLGTVQSVGEYVPFWNNVENVADFISSHFLAKLSSDSNSTRNAPTNFLGVQIGRETAAGSLILG